MIRDILNIAPWWFWIFIAPELAMMALWVISLPFILGFSYIVERCEAKREGSAA